MCTVRTYNCPARASAPTGFSYKLDLGADGWPSGTHSYLSIVQYRGKEVRFYQDNVSFDVFEAAQKLDELFGNIIQIT